jgi:hypothetical protein
MAGIKIPFLADVTKFLGANKNVVDGLEDVVDALDDVGTTGRETGRTVEDAMGDASREARDWGTATERASLDSERSVRRLTDAVERSTREARSLEDGARDAFREIKSRAKDAGDAVDDETRVSFRRAGDTVDEFKDEARSNFSEVASSFTGEMDSAADLVQGTLGGLAGGLAGPLGLAVGAVGAVFGVMYAESQKNAELIEQRTSDMYDDMRESGLSYLSESYITAELDKIYKSTDDAIVKWEELGKIAEATGTDQATVARAYAGDLEAQRVLLDLIAVQLEEVQTMDHAEAADYMTKFGDILGDVQADLEGAGSQARETSDRVGDLRAALLDVPDPDVEVTVSGIPEAEAALNGATYQRYADVHLSASQRQAQTELDRVTSGLRKPTIQMPLTFGMRAV